MLRHVWRIVIVTGVLPSRDSEVRRVIIRIVKANKILKRPRNKLFLIDNTYQDTNQADNAREQKLKQDATITGELKRKYEY